MMRVVIIALLSGLAGVAAARSPTPKVIPPLIGYPRFDEGCGADGKLTAELKALKLQGAANLEPCKPGTIVVAQGKVKGKQLVAFIAHVAGMKVGRLYFAGKPALDEHDFVKKLGGGKKLAKLKDQELAIVFGLITAVKANLVNNLSKPELVAQFPEASGAIQAETVGLITTEPNQRSLVLLQISQPASVGRCQMLFRVRVTLTMAGALTISSDKVAQKGC